VDLEEAFRRHQREIFLYLRRVTGDSGLAEDLAQETFLRAFRAALSYRGDASVRTWLFTIARNVLVSHYRKHTPAVLEPDEEGIVTDPDPTTRLSVEQTLGALPFAAREALVLCDLLGFTPSEAAVMAGVNANALRVRLHRARDQFRKAHPNGA
jgi:RNA polymerase sigma-70 factor, ECF subfamily